jgi:tRNA(Ser,Leu) C12 N-acetylase TAN1
MTVFGNFGGSSAAPPPVFGNDLEERVIELEKKIQILEKMLGIKLSERTDSREISRSIAELAEKGKNR